MSIYHCAECGQRKDDDLEPCEVDPRPNDGHDLLCPDCACEIDIAQTMRQQSAGLMQIMSDCAKSGLMPVNDRRGINEQEREILMPERIQRKRTKGWKMPDNTVYVGRPTKYCNPFRWQALGTRKKAVRLFSKFMKNRLTRKDRESLGIGPVSWLWFSMFRNTILKHAKAELKGKNLACWCPPGEPCHADVLLELANSGK